MRSSQKKNIPNALRKKKNLIKKKIQHHHPQDHNSFVRHEIKALTQARVRKQLMRTSMTFGIT